MLHELWLDAEGRETLCFAGPRGDAARAALAQPARIIWTVEASSHLEVMTQYYAYKGWPPYRSDYPEIDAQSYAERGWE